MPITLLQEVAIMRLYREVHGVCGMFVSFDCMHTQWTNCPKAWQQLFKSEKESGGLTVVREALSDYHLWFWHVSLGYAGLLNDLNILKLLPLLELLVDGSTFRSLEEIANLISFEVDGEACKRCWYAWMGYILCIPVFWRGIKF